MHIYISCSLAKTGAYGFPSSHKTHTSFCAQSIASHLPSEAWKQPGTTPPAVEAPWISPFSAFRSSRVLMQLSLVGQALSQDRPQNHPRFLAPRPPVRYYLIILIPSPPGRKRERKKPKNPIQQSPTLPFLAPAARALASSPGYPNNF